MLRASQFRSSTRQFEVHETHGTSMFIRKKLKFIGFSLVRAVVPHALAVTPRVVTRYDFRIRAKGWKARSGRQYEFFQRIVMQLKRPFALRPWSLDSFQESKLISGDHSRIETVSLISGTNCEIGSSFRWIRAWWTTEIWHGKLQFDHVRSTLL